jgi:hypothetical protein
VFRHATNWITSETQHVIDAWGINGKTVQPTAQVSHYQPA